MVNLLSEFLFILQEICGADANACRKRRVLPPKLDKASPRSQAGLESQEDGGVGGRLLLHLRLW